MLASSSMMRMRRAMGDRLWILDYGGMGMRARERSAARRRSPQLPAACPPTKAHESSSKSEDTAQQFAGRHIIFDAISRN